jgi:NAD(P)H-flavin reductase
MLVPVTALPRRFRAELIARSDLSPRVQAFRFRAHGDFAWAAGQYVDLLLSESGDGKTKAPYSIASVVDARFPSEFELAVARGGSNPGLDEIATGSEFEAEGPLGALTWQAGQNGSAAVLVGVGTGVAPLRALIHEQIQRGGSNEIVLLAGNRSENDMLWAGELTALSKQHPRFRFEPTLSRPTSVWRGRRGRVQEHVSELLEPFGSDVFVYVCGQSAMVAEVVGSVRSRHGLDAARIKGEGH